MKGSACKAHSEKTNSGLMDGKPEFPPNKKTGQRVEMGVQTGLRRKKVLETQTKT